MTEPRQPEWHRFVGDFATIGQSSACHPTLGIAADKCPCCDERRVLVAAIAEDGSEICIALGIEAAQLALTQFAAAVAEGLPAAAKN